MFEKDATSDARRNRRGKKFISEVSSLINEMRRSCLYQSLFLRNYYRQFLKRERETDNLIDG